MAMAMVMVMVMMVEGADDDNGLTTGTDGTETDGNVTARRQLH
jgi:hypothetical protein